MKRPSNGDTQLEMMNNILSSHNLQTQNSNASLATVYIFIANYKESILTNEGKNLYLLKTWIKDVAKITISTSLGSPAE